MNEYRQINEVLDKWCQIALSEPKPDKQLFLMTDANFQMAGYVVITDDDPNKKMTSTRKTYVERRTSLAYGSKTFTLSKKMLPNYATKFLAIYSATKYLVTFLAITETCHHYDRQQISNTIFSNQNDSTTIMEQA